MLFLILVHQIILFEKIYELGLKYNIPGVVFKHPWVDFAHNRNLAWHAALKEGAEGKHSCKWLLIIDADEELIELNSNWKESLTRGIFLYGHIRS